MGSPVADGRRGQLRDWMYEAWAALADVDKHARRGSTWEADASLHEARASTWRLWAAAVAAAYPMFGLASALDGGSPPPDGMADTVAALDSAAQRRAAIALAHVLEAVTERLNVDGDLDVPERLPAWVRRRLDED